MGLLYQLGRGGSHRTNFDILSPQHQPDGEALSRKTAHAGLGWNDHFSGRRRLHYHGDHLGGVTFAFSSGSEIALWNTTGVLSVVVILVTYFHPLVAGEHRLYPVHLMKRMELNILQYAVFVSSGGMMITLYYTPLLFQFTRSDGHSRLACAFYHLYA